MKKVLAIVLVLMMVIGMLAGCGSKTEEPATNQTNEPGKTETPAAPTEPAKTETPVETEQPKDTTYYWVRTAEESNLNPHDCNITANYEIVDMLQIMLYGYEPSADGLKADLVPLAAASEPETTDGGYTWIIKMNPDACWENGERIDANTFEYSIRMQLDPKLLYGTGASVASNYVTIVNAMEYYNQASTGVEVKWEDVGFKAVDADTLQVTLKTKSTATDVMRQFYLRQAGPVYQPIYEKCIAADGASCDYGTSMDKYMCSGKFKLESWQKGAEIVMAKNDLYVHADKIETTKVYSRVVSDEVTRLELFEEGKCDYLSLGTNGMEKYGEDPRMLEYPQKTIHTIEVNQSNVSKPWLNDPEFRKALFYATDRNAIAKLTNNTPAPFFLSQSGVALNDGTLYRDTDGAKALVEKYGANGGYDPEYAKELFDKTLEKYGLTKMTCHMLYTESNDSRRAASEFLQAEWTKIFGEDKFEMTLGSMPSAQLLDTMKNGKKAPTDEYDFGWSGWGLAAESFYPFKKFEKYTTTCSSGYQPYANETVNTLYQECLKEENLLNDKNLLDLTVQMEEAMYQDITCIPVFQAAGHAMVSDRIELPMKQYTAQTGWGTDFCTFK